MWYRTALGHCSTVFEFLVPCVDRLLIKKGRLRWFEVVECEDDADWVICCMMMEMSVSRRRRPRKAVVYRTCV